MSYSDTSSPKRRYTLTNPIVKNIFDITVTSSINMTVLFEFYQFELQSKIFYEYKKNFLIAQ